MTIKDIINTKGWTAECETKLCRYISVQVSFMSPEYISYDETEFDISAYNVTELQDLFKTFCKESFGDSWKKAFNSVEAIIITQCADTLSDLE